MPLVSVIIPVYNVEKFLRQAIESVLNQTCTDWELILVDDGATDGSDLICDEYAGRYDQIQVIHQQNGGLSCARNAGLLQAKGKYIYFLDSDDWIAATLFEKTIPLLEQTKADILRFEAFTVVRFYGNIPRSGRVDFAC